MTFIDTELGESFQHALQSGDSTSLSSATARILQLYADNRLDVTAVAGAVEKAQAERQWETVVTLAEATVAHEDPANVPEKLLRFLTQGLIEIEALSGAECIARRLQDRLNDDDPEAGEVAGLMGRIAKQRFVNYHNPAQLTRAIKAYAAAYEQPLSDDHRMWVGGNLLSLLHRAERERLPTPAGVPRRQQVRDMLVALLGQTDPSMHSVWWRSTNVEVQLALGDEKSAMHIAESLATAKTVEPFQLAALRRQLDEIWELEPEHPIMLALSRSEMGSGAGAAIDVPESESLEKILSTELPAAYDDLVRGLHVSRSVCMIVDRYDNAVGTGFAIPGSELNSSWSDELVLVTNAHVIPDGLPPDLARAKFTKMDDVAGSDNEPPIIDGLELLWTSPVPDLDASVLRFDSGSISAYPRPMRRAEFMPSESDRDAFVYVVGHPQGRPLALSIRGNELLDISDKLLHYMAPTEPGSSGSPVFDKRWDLVGLHHAGSMTMRRLDGSDDRYPANEAINITAIVASLEEAFGADDEGGRAVDLEGLVVQVVESTPDNTLADLSAGLSMQPSEFTVSTDETLEGLDPVTVISVVVAGAEVANKLWKWWRSREETGVQAKVIRPDGTEVHFNELTEEQFLRLVDEAMERA